MQALRNLALALPETEAGIACEGTALESATVMVRKKAFLFLGKTEIRLKLGDSLGEAAKLAAKEPDRYEVGAKGWVKVKYSDDDPPPQKVLARWIEESYRLMAPQADRTPSKSASVKRRGARRTK